MVSLSKKYVNITFRFVTDGLLNVFKKDNECDSYNSHIERVNNFIKWKIGLLYQKMIDEIFCLCMGY
jgi:hypothetical protein